MGREGRKKGKGTSFAPQPPKAGDATFQLLLSCIYLSVGLLAVTRSNMLNIAVEHKLISWGATVRCCQMCFVTLYIRN